jgi:hypothetical protein
MPTKLVILWTLAAAACLGGCVADAAESDEETEATTQEGLKSTVTKTCFLDDYRWVEVKLRYGKHKVRSYRIRYQRAKGGYANGYGGHSHESVWVHSGQHDSRVWSSPNYGHPYDWIKRNFSPDLSRGTPNIEIHAVGDTRYYEPGTEGDKDCSVHFWPGDY